MATAKQKNKILDMLITASPYVVSGLVSYQLAIKMGIIDSPRDKKLAKAFRDSPFVVPTYAQDNLRAISFFDLAMKIFDNDDLYRFNKVNKSIKDTYYSKGYIWDSEDTAVRSLKDNIKSKIDLSLYAGLFSNYVQEPFISYLDSFLENKYQAELWKYLRDLPVLTVKEQSILEKRTGKKITFSNDKIIYTNK